MADRIFTNTLNHPLPLAVWCISDNYDHNDDPYTISTTTLLKPIRQIILARQNLDALRIMDVDNLINVSMGSALHDSVENAWKDRSKAIAAMISLGISEDTATRIYDNTSFEKRLTKTVGRWTVTGKYDIVSEGRVCDIKSSSVYGYMLGSSDWQYKMQMSIYRWLDPELITDDIGTNLYIFTDWSKMKSIQDRSYPQSRIQVKNHTLESTSFIQKYISDKLSLIDKLLDAPQSSIPECTRTELWQDEDVFAYYKNPSSDRSTKNFSTYAEAHTRYIADGSVGRIDTREGKAKACQYCSVSNLCDQYKSLKALGRI